MLLRIIIFAVIIYYIFKLIFRFLMPLFLSSQARKMQEQKEKSHRDYMNRKKAEEGKITIDYEASARKGRSSGQKDGEYVDYEEIK